MKSFGDRFALESEPTVEPDADTGGNMFANVQTGTTTPPIISEKGDFGKAGGGEKTPPPADPAPSPTVDPSFAPPDFTTNAQPIFVPKSKLDALTTITTTYDGVPMVEADSNIVSKLNPSPHKEGVTDLGNLSLVLSNLLGSSNNAPPNSSDPGRASVAIPVPVPGQSSASGGGSSLGLIISVAGIGVTIAVGVYLERRKKKGAPVPSE